MRLHLLSELNTERKARRAAIVVTDMASGAQRLVRETEIENDEFADILKKQLSTAKSAQIESENTDYFIELHLPAPVMVITGAVHVSQTLAPMAKMLGYDVTIIDPRTAFASPERFPQTKIIVDWPDRAFQEIKLDRWTAMIALTHDPKIDDPALEAALKANCFYVGALGSRITHAKRLDRLSRIGMSADLLGRIRGPVGLAIKAATPGEISVSILAEVTQALRSMGQL